MAIQLVYLSAKAIREIQEYIPAAYDELCAALDEAQGSANVTGERQDIRIYVAPDEE